MSGCEPDVAVASSRVRAAARSQGHSEVIRDGSDAARDGCECLRHRPLHGLPSLFSYQCLLGAHTSGPFIIKYARTGNFTLPARTMSLVNSGLWVRILLQSMTVQPSCLVWLGTLVAILFWRTRGMEPQFLGLGLGVIR